MKKKWVNNLNLEPTAFVGEINKQPSQTVPDMALDLRSMVQDYNNGMPITGFDPVYNNEIEVPDLKKMDLSERQEYLDRLKETIQEQQAKMQQELKDQQEAARKEQIRRWRETKAIAEEEIDPKKNTSEKKKHR